MERMMFEKIIGTISSILLIISFIFRNIILQLFFKDNTNLNHLDDVFGVVIYKILTILLHFSILIYLKRFKYKTEYLLMIIFIVLFVLISLLHFFNYFITFDFGTLSAFIGLSSNIIFIIFGIKILKKNEDEFLNLKYLKYFVLSWFITSGLIFIMMMILRLIHKYELSNLYFVTSLWFIPYTFSLLFFLKDKRLDQNL